MITIDKGIPVPDRKPGQRNKYPFRDMMKGDSFLFPKDVKKQTVWASVSWANKKYGPIMQWIVTEVDDGMRCWRVK